MIKYMGLAIGICFSMAITVQADEFGERFVTQAPPALAQEAPDIVSETDLNAIAPAAGETVQEDENLDTQIDSSQEKPQNPQSADL